MLGPQRDQYPHPLAAENAPTDLGEDDRQVGGLVLAFGVDHPDAEALHFVPGFTAPEVGVDNVEVRDGNLLPPGEPNRQIDCDFRLAGAVVAHDQDDTLLRKVFEILAHLTKGDNRGSAQQDPYRQPKDVLTFWAPRHTHTEIDKGSCQHWGASPRNAIYHDNRPFSGGQPTETEVEPKVNVTRQGFTPTATATPAAMPGVNAAALHGRVPTESHGRKGRLSVRGTAQPSRLAPGCSHLDAVGPLRL